MSATGSRSTPLHHAFIRELISRQDPKGYIATCRVIAGAPTPDFSVVAKSDRKILAFVLAGADDKVAPYDGCVDKIAEGLHAEVQVIDGVGHRHAIEAPEVETFLQNFYKTSDTASALEEYADQYTDDATHYMGIRKSKAEQTFLHIENVNLNLEHEV
ncbi:hypothetical protein V1524DRAFT_412161 [Lipomyces starkeyi]